MSFRTRVLLSFAAVVVIPVAVVALGIRGEIDRRMTAQYDARVAALASVIEEDLRREAEEIADHLSALGSALSADNRFRVAADGNVGAVESTGDRSYLLDYAGDAMRLTGLSMLQIQNESGRILSSGHFRNAFDVVAPELPRELGSLPSGTALTRVRTAAGEFLALVRIDSVRVGGRTYDLVGGVEVGEAFIARLTRDPELSVRLVYPGGGINAATMPAAGAVARTIPVAYVDPSGGRRDPAEGGARFEIAYSGVTLQAIRRSTDIWFAVVLAGATAMALIVAGWLSARVAGPLAALARKTARVDLDRMDVDFPTRRRDEIGQLSRTLGQMTDRLRADARDLKDAERRATLGELARQVNHDVRNGLAPIRNVLRHLDEVARDEPATLARIYEERKGSLASSVAYLENLAGTYRRLSTRAGRGSTDASASATLVAESAGAGSPVAVRAEVDRTLPEVRGDPVTLRRILENLVTNAKDASNSGPGAIRIRTERGSVPDTVRILVEDTGAGMTEEDRTRAFDDFFTTKESGTGLGLPVVRRLVTDLGGTVAIESEEGRGTRVIVELPSVGNGQPERAP